MSVHKNPAPKKRVKTVMNNSLSKCKSADDSIYNYLSYSLMVRGSELEEGSHDEHEK